MHQNDMFVAERVMDRAYLKLALREDRPAGNA